MELGLALDQRGSVQVRPDELNSSTDAARGLKPTPLSENKPASHLPTGARVPAVGFPDARLPRVACPYLLPALRPGNQAQTLAASRRPGSQGPRP